MNPPPHTHTPTHTSLNQCYAVSFCWGCRLRRYRRLIQLRLSSRFILANNWGYNNQSSVRWMAEMKIGGFKSCKSFICSPNSTLFHLCRLFYRRSSLWCPWIGPSAKRPRIQLCTRELFQKSQKCCTVFSESCFALTGLWLLHWGKKSKTDEDFYS